MSDTWQVPGKVHRPSPGLEPGDLSGHYGRDVLEFLVLDPTTAFAYWEVSPSSRHRAVEQFGPEHFSRTRLILQVRRTDATDSSEVALELDVSGPVRSWFVGLPAGSCFRAHLGFSDGEAFFPIVNSGEFCTPSTARASEAVDWMPVEELYERVARAGGN